MINNIKKYNYPDSSGHFEEFGGKYVPETLIPALNELEEHYLNKKSNKFFQDKFIFFSFFLQLLNLWCIFKLDWDSARTIIFS